MGKGARACTCVLGIPMYRDVVVDSQKRAIKTQVGDSKENDYVGDNVHGNSDVYFWGGLPWHDYVAMRVSIRRRVGWQVLRRVQARSVQRDTRHSRKALRLFATWFATSGPVQLSLIIGELPQKQNRLGYRKASRSANQD